MTFVRSNRFLPAALIALVALVSATSQAAGTATAESTAPTAPDAGALRPDQQAFRALYRELVETNTTLSAGSCTEAAEKMAARLLAAGLPKRDVELVVLPEKPKEGNLVARLPGRDPKLRPILLLAHIDVVEAKREDWARDPFTLVEEDGFFYGRGVADDKAMAAIWVDTLIRLAESGERPKRTLKLALTCGEETIGAFNGAEYLSAHRRELIDAAIALNEGASGILDEQGRRILLTLQVGEKTAQNYRLEVTNPGGHSSLPVKDNAIHRLATALTRIAAHEFPIELSDTTRGYFAKTAEIVGGEMGAAMKALLRDPGDAKAIALVTSDRRYNAALRTTCVATMLEGGHATNALPQRARANVNCRIYPGTTPETVRQQLAEIVGDPEVAITIPEIRGPVAKTPPLSRAVLAPIERVSAKHYPGLPIVPILQPGATDAQFTSNAGIPTYGIGGIFFESDGGGAHGLNERLRVRSLYDGRDYLHDLVKAFADETGPLP
ncbi:MAG: M20/M25/M40 family metallo-hydrolase [Myxococcota bacterium]